MATANGLEMSTAEKAWDRQKGRVGEKRDCTQIKKMNKQED